MQNRTATLAIALMLATIASSQTVPCTLGPESSDLGAASDALFMRSDARVQQFFEVAELGAARIPMRGVSLRFDGPDAGARVVKHSVDGLKIRVGATALGVDALGAVFDQNLTNPLTTVFVAQDFEFGTDALVGVGPEPWGGADQQLRFRFEQPIVVDVPSGGCLVVEFSVRGNSNRGQDAARLDMYFDQSVGLGGAMVYSSGSGCWRAWGGNTPQIETVGQGEVGTAIHIGSSGFPANVPVVPILTLGLFQNPLPLSQAGCRLYVNPATGSPLDVQLSNASGSVPVLTPGGGVPIPRAPGLCGVRLYVQNVAPTASGGLAVSDYRTIRVGCPPSPTVRGWQVSHSNSASAPIATSSVAGGFAMRIE